VLVSVTMLVFVLVVVVVVMVVLDGGGEAVLPSRVLMGAVPRSVATRTHTQRARQ
jgi:hypothetical protein